MLSPDLLSALGSESPASETSLAAVESALGCPLPADYRAFLLARNGGEGFVGEHYLILWKVEELVAFNRDYEVVTYAPGLVLFGSDGGGEAFGFDTRQPASPVVQVPFVGMSLEDSKPVAANVTDLIRKMDASDGSLW